MSLASTVPFIDLAPTRALVEQEVLGDWAQLLERCQFVGGPAVTQLEEGLKAELRVAHAVACANGTDALLVGLQAMGIGPGDRVAVPNLTFWATYEAVAQIGAIPVLIDIDPQDLQMSFDELVQAHRELGLKAAILVHLFGWASGRLQDFREFCSRHGIRLLEDGAQAYGVKVNGKSVFEDAELATLSFYPAKVLGGCMDGGAILSRDAELANTSRVLCNHGRSTHYSYSHVGWNSRMSGLNASYLFRLLPKMSQVLENRLQSWKKYGDLLGGETRRWRWREPPRGITPNAYLAVIESLELPGEELSSRLKALGIGTGRVYPEALSEQAPSRGAERVSDLKHSQEFCRKVLNLPLYFGMSSEFVSRSSKTLTTAFEESSK